MKPYTSNTNNAQSFLTGIAFSTFVRQQLYSHMFSTTHVFHEVHQTTDLFEISETNEIQTMTDIHPCFAGCLKHLIYQHISSIQLCSLGFFVLAFVFYCQDTTKHTHVQVLPTHMVKHTMKFVEFMTISLILILMTDVDFVF
jgi:hypothetical protein